MISNRDRRERAPLLLLALFAVCALALVRVVAAPDMVREIAALALVFVLPGSALALLWPGGVTRGWSWILALSLPLSMGVIWGASMCGRMLDWPPLAVSAGLLFGVFILCFVALLRAPTRPEDGGLPVLSAVLVCGMVLAAWLGAPTGPTTDGPDHIATSAAMIRLGTVGSVNPLTPEGEVTRSDPRKGVLHVGLAMASALANQPVVSVWTRLPMVLVLSWLAAWLALARGFGWGWRFALLTAVLALVFTGGFVGPWVTRLGYGAHGAMLCSLAGFVVAWEYFREPRRALLLLLGVITLAGAAVHPMMPAFLVWPLGLYLLMPGVPRTVRVQGAVLLGGAMLVASPVLVRRFLELQGPSNPLHQQVMPILDLAPGISVLWPPEALRLLGLVGVLGVLCLPWLWRSRVTGSRFIAAWTVACLVPALVPGVFNLAQSLTSSFPIKLLFLVPFPLAIAAALQGRGHRVGKAVLIVGLVVAIPGVVRSWNPDAVRGWRPAGVDAGLDLVRQIDGSMVIAADPWVSSLIASETQHQPLTVFHQHGHPKDVQGLERLNRLGLILSPRVPLEDKQEWARNIDYVLLPETGTAPYRPGFGVASGGELDLARVRQFRASGQDVGRQGGWAVFRWPETPAGSDSSFGDPAPVHGRGIPLPQGAGSTGPAELLSVVIPPALQRGTEFPVEAWWETRGADPWPAQVHLRFVHEGASGKWKVDRLLGRLVKGEMPRDRFRAVAEPFSGCLMLARLPESSNPDTLWVNVPPDLIPGRYNVSIRVLPQPMFEHLAIQDLLFEQDRWSALVIGTVLVERGQGGSAP